MKGETQGYLVRDGEEEARLDIVKFQDLAHCFGDSQCSCNYLCNIRFPEILSYKGTGLLHVLSLSIPHIHSICEQALSNSEMKE